MPSSLQHIGRPSVDLTGYAGTIPPINPPARSTPEIKSAKPDEADARMDVPQKCPCVDHPEKRRPYQPHPRITPIHIACMRRCILARGRRNASAGSVSLPYSYSALSLTAYSWFFPFSPLPCSFLSGFLVSHGVRQLLSLACAIQTIWIIK